MTLYQEIFDAFLAKISDDEWLMGLTDAIVEEDMRQILESAIPFFKFPRVSLSRDSTGFLETLSTQEVQVLATYMKSEWLNRTVLNWENLRPLYDEKDFSPGNFLEKLTRLLQLTDTKAQRLEAIYYRSVNGSPFDYRKLTLND